MSTMGARLIITLIFLTSLASASAAFYRFYVVRDYMVFANVSCDPNQYSCFIGDGDAMPLYYAKMEKKAVALPVCNGWSDQCPELTCDQDDASCTVEYCQPDTEDSCYGPVAASQ